MNFKQALQDLVNKHKVTLCLEVSDGRATLSYDTETSTGNFIAESERNCVVMEPEKIVLQTDEVLRKCIISRYDPNCTKPPYNTIPILAVDVIQVTGLVDGGVDFYNKLHTECRRAGFTFKFYSSGKEKGYDYEIVVE